MKLSGLGHHFSQSRARTAIKAEYGLVRLSQEGEAVTPGLAVYNRGASK